MKEQSAGKILIASLAVWTITATIFTLFPELYGILGIMRYVLLFLCPVGVGTGFYLRHRWRGMLKLLALPAPYGIKGIYANDLKRTIKEYREPIKEIRIAAISGDRLFISIKDGLVKLLAEDAGIRVRVLLAAPGTEFVKELKDIEGVRADISGEINISGGAVKEIKKLAQAKAAKEGKTAGKLEIRYSSTLIRSAITVINEAWGCLTFYLPPVKTENSISLELENNGEASLLSNCITHFDAVWEKCAVKKSGMKEAHE
jgi:hypothetical protein